MIQVNRIYLIFNRLVTKKFLVDTSAQKIFIKKSKLIIFPKKTYILLSQVQLDILVKYQKNLTMQI